MQKMTTLTRLAGTVLPKFRLESIVESSEMDWSIVKKPALYMGQTPEGGRTNILTWVKSSLEQHKPIKVVNDQIRHTHICRGSCKSYRSYYSKKR
jgi:dTDP-4-dehydrorhamnose reductase